MTRDYSVYVSSTSCVHIVIGSKLSLPKIKHLSKNTLHLKRYKVLRLFCLYSVLLLLWACVSSFYILMIT